MDTRQALFVRLLLAMPRGCSPSALRRVRQTLETALVETAATWEQARMGLILLDLHTGDIVLEATADDRSDATWKALVEQRRDALNAQGRALVRARAQALIQLVGLWGQVLNCQVKDESPPAPATTEIVGADLE